MSPNFVVRSGDVEPYLPITESTPMRSTMKMMLTLSVLVSAPLFLSTVFANAQSFSCASAQTSTEFAICNNEDLLTLDEKLAAVFYNRKSNLQTTPQRQKISRDQNAWKQLRNRCKLDWTCLKLRYNERIQALSITF